MPEPYYSYPTTLALAIKNIVLNKREKRERIAMIRLDSDDTIMPYYLILVDEYIFIHESNPLNAKVLEQPLNIDIPYGLQCQLNASKAWLTLWPENNFTSLVVPTNQIREELIPFFYAHDELPSNIHRHVLATNVPMWIQGIHSSNLCNEIFAWSIPLNGSRNIIELLVNS